jgi:hypothetical protein
MEVTEVTIPMVKAVGVHLPHSRREDGYEPHAA